MSDDSHAGASDSATAGAGSTSSGETGAAASRSGRLGRRRRANVPGGRHHSHRVKVTPEEEARLLVLAQEESVSVPRLLVESALAGVAETSTERRAAMAELFATRRLLSNNANNINQVAKVANSTDEIQPEAVHYLREARRLVSRIDAAIDGLSQT